MAALAKSRFLSGQNIVGTCGLAVGLLLSGAALAEDASDPIAIELRKSFAADGSAPETIDWDALNWDPWSVTSPAKQPTLKTPVDPTDTAMKWDGKVNSDGSRALTAKKQLPTALDANVGVDLGVAPDSPAYAQPGHLPGSPAPTNTGSAWANVSVVPGASVDARLNPQQDQAKLGTTLKKSVPINNALSVSVENGYAVTDTYAAPVSTLSSVPSTPSTPPAPSRVYSTDGVARVTINQTGTTFSTGTTLSSADEKWRRSLGAEQKLFGGLNISGSVKENDTGTLDKTLSAGFKTSW
jgi:hypothetical protein